MEAPIFLFVEFGNSTWREKHMAYTEKRGWFHCCCALHPQKTDVEVFAPSTPICDLMEGVFTGVIMLRSLEWFSHPICLMSL